MDERAFEHMLGQLMKQDFSAGTESFRDALLERCLAAMDEQFRCACLEDDDLELLAAAGTDPTSGPNALEPHDAIGHNEDGDLLA